MAPSSQEIAGWTFLALNVVYFGYHLFLYVPVKPRSVARKYPLVEFNFAYGFLVLNFLIGVAYFLAMAQEMGKFTRTDGSTNWIRYVGSGLQTTLLVGAFTFIEGGGAFYTIMCTTFTLFAGAMFVFTSLTPYPDNIGLFVLGGVGAMLACVFIFLLDLARKKIWFVWRASVALLILAHAALAGLDTIKTDVVPNTIVAWLFGGLSGAGGAILLCIFFFFVDSTFLATFLWNRTVTS